MSKNHISVVGGGFSGLAAASYLAKSGHEVHVYEKNDTLGGRARYFSAEGFHFDMGPSWYWMPDVMEDFFSDFNHKSSDFYALKSLNPQFEMVFENETMQVPEKYDDLRDLFESIELGAGQQLDRFMKSARYKYEIGMKDFVQKPCHSWMEFVSMRSLRSAMQLDLLTDFHRYVRRYFKDPKLVALMEFPVIFLGAAPRDIPALYSLMNYGGYGLGTWYPLGGFSKIIDAMVEVAETYGVHFHTNSTVDQIDVHENHVCNLVVNGTHIPTDIVVASSDYSHTESLLATEYRNYDEKYWEGRTFAPSCLIFYLGFDQIIPNLKHHTLFFEHDLSVHIDSIYKTKTWAENPLFYACCPSKTDDGVAPVGHENVFLLMPIPIGVEDGDEIRERYFEEMIDRIEKHTGASDLRSHIVYKRSYCVRDFMKDYNAYQGNAYGLANTLKQTAVWKPSIRNKHVDNLYYTGQLTVPGPGVPPSLISGKIVAAEINKLFTYEKAV